MDDILNYVPARITMFFLLSYFLFRGTGARAWRVMRRDGKKRPGFNGGIVMATMAGGCGSGLKNRGFMRLGVANSPLKQAARKSFVLSG